MNKKIKTKIRKLKEDNRKLRNENKSKIDIDINKFYGISYAEKERKNLIENTLKLFVKRYYGRIEHTNTRIEIDAREIEGMKQYNLEIEKNPFHQTLEIIVR